MYRQDRTAASDGNVPDECCFQYYQRRIPKQLIVAYEMTRSDCTHKGVICANPDESLIDRIMKAIDESRFHFAVSTSREHPEDFLEPRPHQLLTV
ncbi:C-C motif chemokine 4 homolog [Oncorhynchus masou masou]|uniref:C-C motif chemokine 4 homolog n=1 Tax=Oncorhynchus masou masou TaxID=90313 RepID=UPI0031832F64